MCPCKQSDNWALQHFLRHPMVTMWNNRISLIWEKFLPKARAQCTCYLYTHSLMEKFLPKARAHDLSTLIHSWKNSHPKQVHRLSLHSHTHGRIQAKCTCSLYLHTDGKIPAQSTCALSLLSHTDGKISTQSTCTCSLYTHTLMEKFPPKHMLSVLTHGWKNSRPKHMRPVSTLTHRWKNSHPKHRLVLSHWWKNLGPMRFPIVS